MWFVLGIIVGIILTLAAEAGLVAWIKATDRQAEFEKWMDNFEPAGERKSVTEGRIGTFVLNDGEIERMPDA